MRLRLLIRTDRYGKALGLWAVFAIRLRGMASFEHTAHHYASSATATSLIGLSRGV